MSTGPPQRRPRRAARLPTSARPAQNTPRSEFVSPLLPIVAK